MLTIKNLSINYLTESGSNLAVDKVSFGISAGQSLGIVGESGSGKSTLGLSIMRLLPQNATVKNGEIFFQGRHLLDLSAEEMRKIRGAKISMVFQDPFTSLNPVYTVGDQIAEAIQLHQGLSKKQAWEKAIEMLDTVHIKDAKKRIKDYPHQFSGGMRQRAMIAMALACNPELLIADEPTTALDVTIQAEILNLLQELRQKFNLTLIYITHNFGIIRQVCYNVLVMHHGQVIEQGKTTEVLSDPKQAYTQKLIECVRFFNG